MKPLCENNQNHDDKARKPQYRKEDKYKRAVSFRFFQYSIFGVFLSTKEDVKNGVMMSFSEHLTSGGVEQPENPINNYYH